MPYVYTRKIPLVRLMYRQQVHCTPIRTAIFKRISSAKHSVIIILLVNTILNIIYQHAKSLLEKGASVALISKALGHSELAVTTQYLDLDVEDVANNLRDFL